MNHHLSNQDAEWIKQQGLYAISGWRGNDHREGNLIEEKKRTSLIYRFENKIGSVKAASEYFEVSTTTWRA